MLDGDNTYWNIFDYSDFITQRKDSLECKSSLSNHFFDGLPVNPISIQNSSVEQIGNVGIKNPFSFEQVDGIFVFLLFFFVLLVHIFRNGIAFFKESFFLIFSSRKDISLFGATTVTEFWYSFLLIFQTIFLSAVVLYVYFYETDISTVHPTDSFWEIMIFVSVITLGEGLKFLFYKFVGYIFDIQGTVSVWLRGYLIVLEMIGLVAFIPVLLLIYSDYYHTILFFFFLALFLVSRLIIFYRIIIFFLKKDVNFLYLIVYLCSVEIIPYILLYEGLKYVYKMDVINLIWH